jgi:hypothetical protein
MHKMNITMHVKLVTCFSLFSQTHPVMEVFMSSVDLHNQWLLQKDFPEAIAIVVNPTPPPGYVC